MDRSAHVTAVDGIEASHRPCRVLLVPGIWMPGWSMRWLAKHLADAGFSPHCLGYAGVFGGPQPTLPRLRAAMAHADAVVAHSLGGLMVLEALRDAPELPVRRVVCLGSPLAGSAVAATLARRRMGFMCGRSGKLLSAGVPFPLSAKVQVGAIAGTSARGVGRMLGMLDGPGDGTVGVAETRWPGLSAHTTVSASHSGLLFSRTALRQVRVFLREGEFEPAP